MKAAMINVNSVSFEKQQNGVVVMTMLCDNGLQYNVYMLQKHVLKAAKAADRGEVAAIETDIEAMGFEMHGVTMVIDFGGCSVRFKDEYDVKLYVSIGCIDMINAVKKFINSLNNKTEKRNDADTAVEDFVKRLIDNFGVEVISTISSIKSVKDDKEEYKNSIKEFIRDINNM